MSTLVEEDPIRAAINATMRLKHYARSCVPLAEDARARCLLEAVAENIDAEVAIIDAAVAELARRCAVA